MRGKRSHWGHLISCPGNTFSVSLILHWQYTWLHNSASFPASACPAHPRLFLFLPRLCGSWPLHRRKHHEWYFTTLMPTVARGTQGWDPVLRRGAWDRGCSRAIPWTPTSKCSSLARRCGNAVCRVHSTFFCFWHPKRLMLQLCLFSVRKVNMTMSLFLLRMHHQNELSSTRTTQEIWTAMSKDTPGPKMPYTIRGMESFCNSFTADKGGSLGRFVCLIEHESGSCWGASFLKLSMAVQVFYAGCSNDWCGGPVC